MYLVGDRGVETTEVEAHMATYCLFATNHQWQLAHRQYNFDQDSGLAVTCARTVRAMPKRHL